MFNKHPETVLLVGNYRPSLTIIRKLAANGIQFIIGLVGESDSIDGVQRSRYADHIISLPSWELDESDYLTELNAVLEKHASIDTLMPVSDQAVRYMNRIRDKLPSRLALVLPQKSVVDTCTDKSLSFELCERIQIPCARYRRSRDLKSLHEAAIEIQCPLVIKPANSNNLLPGDRKAVLCDTMEELEEFAASWGEQDLDLLVQQRFRGPRHNIYFAAHHGGIVGACEIKILRTDRADGTGLAVEGHSQPPTPSLQEATTRILKELDYTGVGCIQFLVEDNSDFTFLELNPRLGANFSVVESCGLDLVDFAIALASDDFREPPTTDPWHVGKHKRFAWTTGDLKGLKFQWQQSKISFWQAIGWVSKTVLSTVRANCHVTWRWSDPWPTLAEYLTPVFGLSREATPVDSRRKQKAP